MSPGAAWRPRPPAGAPLPPRAARPKFLSLVISLVPEISPVLEVVEDLLLFGVDGWREGLDGAVDRDGRRAQRAELANDVADGQGRAVLGFAGDGQGGGH